MLRFLTIFLFLILFSCTHEERKKNELNDTNKSEIKDPSGSRSGFSAYRTITINKEKLQRIKAKEPKLIPANVNVHAAGKPKTFIVGALRTATPGVDSFLHPKTIATIGRSIRAGIPERTIAKDMANKDQNPANFSNFNKLQGLKHGNVRSLLQDRLGNLWFGTYGGACRFDGKTFTHYTEKEGLCHNIILCMYEDSSGNIWFGSNGGGISRFDGKTFTNYTEEDGLSNNVVWAIQQDKVGNMWFGTEGGGVSCLKGNTFKHYTTKQGLNDNVVLSIQEDRYGKLWFGTGSGACCFNGKTFTQLKQSDGLSNGFVLSIYEDRLGNLWFGTGRGISRYDGNRVEAIERGDKSIAQQQDDLMKVNGKAVKTIVNYSETEGFNNNPVWSILEDKTASESTGLWFCTGGGGLIFYNGKEFTHYTEKDGLSNNIVWSALEDRSGNLWLGTGGGGVLRYDGKTFTHFSEREGLSSHAVLAISNNKNFTAEENVTWFGTNGGGLLKYDGKNFSNYTQSEGLSNNLIRAILIDRSSNMWIGTDNGINCFDGKTFTHFTEKDGLISNVVLSILEDRSGNIWFSNGSGGLTRYNGRSFTHFIDKSGLSKHNILCILEDKNGVIWCATDGGGVLRYNGRSFERLTVKDGLSNNVVMCILEDREGYLWFGTSGGGVSRYNGKTFTHFTEKDGLSNNVVMSMLEDKAGNLWFGTRFGISKIEKNVLSLLSKKDKEELKKNEQVIFKTYEYTDGYLGIGVFGGKTMLEDNAGNIWIGANDRLSVYRPSVLDVKDTLGPNIQLTGISLFNEEIAWSALEQTRDSVLTLGNGIKVDKLSFSGTGHWYDLPENLSLDYNNNYLTFNFIGITMKQPKKVRYQFILEGNDKNWSALNNRTEVSYGNLAPGNYSFKVKAINGDGYWSREFKYDFTIRPPWWQTWWFRSLVVLIIIASVVLYIKWRERALKQRQQELEQTVETRTAEVIQEKKIVEQQKHLIEEKHKEITDSINYAERIQRSFLATKQHLDEHLNVSSRYDVPRYGTSTRSDTDQGITTITGTTITPTACDNYFILFKPKDVVSGDFYWSATLNNGCFALATADSTGHGVPGAIMSLLNITSLEKAIESHTEPSDILNATRNIIIERLKKDGSPEGGKDGMDCSLLSFNKDKTKLQIAAAHNPVWIMRSKANSEIAEVSDLPLTSIDSATEIIEIKANKMPVGKHDKQNIPFTQHEIALKKGDVVYTLTDGFPDQFGGPAGKKFMSKRLKELLQQICHLPMSEQQLLLEKTFSEWVGDLDQIDDVTIIGIRV